MCHEVTSAVPRRPAIKQECLDYFLMFGERHLNHLPDESVSYYNSERTPADIICRRVRPIHNWKTTSPIRTGSSAGNGSEGRSRLFSERPPDGRHKKSHVWTFRRTEPDVVKCS